MYDLWDKHGGKWVKMANMGGIIGEVLDEIGRDMGDSGENLGGRGSRSDAKFESH